MAAGGRWRGRSWGGSVSSPSWRQGIDEALAGRGRFFLLARRAGNRQDASVRRSRHAWAAIAGWRCCGGVLGRRAGRRRTGPGWNRWPKWLGRSTTGSCAKLSATAPPNWPGCARKWAGGSGTSSAVASAAVRYGPLPVLARCSRVGPAGRGRQGPGARVRGSALGRSLVVGLALLRGPRAALEPRVADRHLSRRGSPARSRGWRAHRQDRTGGDHLGPRPARSRGGE